MKGITEDFLLFIVGIFVILIVLATVFGRGIAYNFLGFMAGIEPTNLQENIRNILTVASYSSGDFESKIPVSVKHTITISDDPYPTIFVETENGIASNTPQPFLTNCEIMKRCTKSCKLIGDRCSSQDDCCGMLSCDTSGHCASTYGDCGNGILDDGEECDPGSEENDLVYPQDCTEECSDSCRCLTDYGVGDVCSSKNDCYRLLECQSVVEFESIGGTLLIKKYNEGDTCKLIIEGIE